MNGYFPTEGVLNRHGGGSERGEHGVYQPMGENKNDIILERSRLGGERKGVTSRFAVLNVELYIWLI